MTVVNWFILWHPILVDPAIIILAYIQNWQVEIMLCDLEVVDVLAVFIDRVSDDSISLTVSDSISLQRSS